MLTGRGSDIRDQNNRSTSRPAAQFRQASGDTGTTAAHAAVVGRLRRSVARRFTTALGLQVAPAAWRTCAAGRDVDRLFWSLMSEPRPVSTSAAYVDRLVSRLVLLHECYEQAMDELALPRTTAVERGPGDVVPVTS